MKVRTVSGFQKQMSECMQRPSKNSLFYTVSTLKGGEKPNYSNGPLTKERNTRYSPTKQHAAEICLGRGNELPIMRDKPKLYHVW